LTHQDERDAVDGCRQGGMDIQTFAASVVEVPQYRGVLMGSVEQLGGIVQHENHIVELGRRREPRE